MSKYHILFLLALLIGCGNGTVNNGYGYSFDDQKNGLRVKYADSMAAEPSASDLYKIFVVALNCADRIGPPERKGVTVNPPLVIIVAPGTNDPYDGLTYYATGTVTVERQWIDDRWLWVHEFERWIAYSRGVQIDQVDSAPELICEWF